MSQSFPVLSIVGTTAVGKTEFAFQLAEQLCQTGFSGVEIISADSRQIYTGLEMLSGADVPQDFERKDSYFEKGDVRLYGVSLLSPTEEWSVSQFQEYAQGIIKQAVTENRTVLVVGGTGFYHRHLFTSDPILRIPPNQELREKLKQMSAAELQLELKKIAPDKLRQMNNSDINNPRRLIRAIEVVSAGVQHVRGTEIPPHKFIGLKADLASIFPKIKARVQWRFEHGVVEEVSSLLGKYSDSLSNQVETTLGFTQVREFIEQKITENECIERWALAEKQYAQRQLTWWKQHSNVYWFEVNGNENWKKEAILSGLQLLTR